MQAEKEIKKQWLLSLIFYASICALFFITSFITSGRLNVDDAAQAYSELFAQPLVVFLAAYVTYLLAYRLRGTKWLLFTAIASLLTESMFYLEEKWADFDWSMMIVSWGAVIFYCISSLRMWRLNGSLLESSPTEVSLDPLEKEARKVRRDWLTAFWVVFGFLGLGIVGIFAMLVEAGASPDLNESAGLAAILLFALLAFGALYYFAYHKQGTKWLMLNLVTSPIAGLREMADAVSNGFSQDLFFLVIGIGLNIYFWIHCYRLWKLNTSLKNMPKTSDRIDEATVVVNE